MKYSKKISLISVTLLLFNWVVSATEHKEIKARAAIQVIQQPFSKLLTSFTLPTFSAGKPNISSEQKYIVDNFGNKTFNLCILHAFSKQLSNPALFVVVPPFCSISHRAIAAYLNSAINLDELWGQFVSYQGTDKTLNPHATSVAAQIREKITKAFEDPTAMPEFIRNEINELIKDYAGFLMVRSSGYEDRIDIANAGGNESVPVVEANLEAIWHAMSIVVSSYFSEKSLQQRLLAGDIITGPYFVPVLLQHMIGEKLWDGKPRMRTDIPVSGVLFTQEAEGNTPGIVQIQTAYGHNQGVVNSLVAVDTFYVGPSGIIHPIIRQKKERLVPAKIDSAFTLTMVPNASPSTPSLTSDIVHNLDRAARTIQTLYKTPMDVEFVIMDTKGKLTLYLVQARPLVRKAYAQQPSYISDTYLSTLPQTQIKQGISIGVAGGFVRDIESNDQLIMRTALPQALNAYHDSPERDRIKGIVVATMAPATSHEATQFRSYALPILVVSENNLQAIDQMNEPFFFDTQRALIAPKPGSEKEYKSLIVPGWYTHPIPMQLSLLSQYALPRQALIASQMQAYVKSLSWNKADIDNTKESYRTLLDALKKSSDKTEIILLLKRMLHRLSLLTTIKTASSVIGKAGSSIDYMQLYLNTDSKEKQGLLYEAQLIMSNALICAAEILYTIDHRSDLSENDARLAYLYTIKFLEALILQQHDAAIINDYSYVQLRSMYQQEVEAVEKLSPALPKPSMLKKVVGATTFEYLVQLDKLDKLTLNNSMSKAWDSFVRKLTQEIAQADAKERVAHQVTVRRFSTMVSQLRDLDVLDTWINTSFAQQTTLIETSAIDVSKMLLTEFENTEVKSDRVSNKNVIDWVNKHKDMLTRWSNKIDEWGDPDTTKFTKLFDQFQKQFVTEFISGKDAAAQKIYTDLLYETLITYAQQHAPLTSLFNKADRLGKLVLLQCAREVIDVYDKILKGLTGSPLYKDKNLQTQRFALLLAPYLMLMEELITLARDQESSLMLGEKAWGHWIFKTYLEKIKSLYVEFAKQGDASLLKASRTFSVGAAQIGSKVDFSRALPHTLEDIFTLAHQNMLTVLSVLNKEYGITKEMLPPLVQDVCSTIESISIHEGGVAAEVFKSNLVGIEYHFPYIIVYYNIPLRQHSSTFEIRYNKNKPDQAILDCKFFGHNEGNRMNGLVAYAYLASFASDLSFATKPFTTTAQGSGKDFSALTEFAWLITNKTNLKEVAQYLEMFGRTTLSFVSVTPFMFKSINDIHNIINAKWAKFVEALPLYNKSLNLSFGELKDLLEHGFPQLPDSFFAQTVFFNAWFTEQYIMAQMYDKALMIIQASLTHMIKENNYTYHTNLTTQMLFEDCLYSLRNLFEDISDLQARILTVLDATIFVQKTMKQLLPKLSYDQNGALLDLMLTILEKKPNARVFEVLEGMLNEPTITLYSIPQVKLRERIESIIEKFKGKTGVAEWYKTLCLVGFKQAQQSLKDTQYDVACNLVIELIQHATKDPAAYTYALDIARELCKAQKTLVNYVSHDPIGRGFIKKPRPGIQYYYAGEIAGKLVETGQVKAAEEIQTSLRKIQVTLNETPSSEDQKTALEYLEKGLEEIETKMKKVSVVE